MRAMILSTLVVGCFVGGTLRAEQEKKAREAVDRAIKAIGGEEKLAKFNAQTWKVKGTYHGTGQALPFEGNYAVQWPDRFKGEIAGVFMIVLNGEKGWIRSNDETKEMNEQQLKQQLSDRYVGWISTLAPLKDPAFNLASIGDFDVNGQPTVGVKVTRANKPDVELYFSKDNGRLIKMAYRGQSFEQEFKEVAYESHFEDYQDNGGVLMAKKTTMKRDGEPYVEVETVELQTAAKLDDSVFHAP